MAFESLANYPSILDDLDFGQRTRAKESGKVRGTGESIGIRRDASGLAENSCAHHLGLTARL
jgi:hypothetical protein